MKKIIIFSIVLFAFASFASAQNWQTDINTAKKIAAKENKVIILVFQGSDWCAPCMKLNREIWSSQVFVDYAKDNYVMLLADFPRKKRNTLTDEQQTKNSKLAEMYNNSGFFPLVVILNSEGNVLGQTGYKKMTPEEYINHLNSFNK